MLKNLLKKRKKNTNLLVGDLSPDNIWRHQLLQLTRNDDLLMLKHKSTCVKLMESKAGNKKSKIYWEKRGKLEEI